MRGCARSRFVSLAERWRGGGGALGTTRGHQGSGERTAASQSAAEPARRTVGTRVPRSILRPFGSFASASRAPFAGKLRVSFFALSCLAVSLPPTYPAARSGERVYSEICTSFFVLSPETTDRPTVRPSVRSLVFRSRRKHRRLPRLGQETTRLPSRIFGGFSPAVGSYPTKVAATTTRISSAW